MLDLLLNWYKRRFVDPQAVALLAILLVGFGIIYFFHTILAPLLIAIVLAYLLEWPTNKLTQIRLSRTLAVITVLILFSGIVAWCILVIMPIVWQQGVTFISDLPNMLSRLDHYRLALPDRYPTFINTNLLDILTENIRAKLPTVGELFVKFSMASLFGLLKLSIYLVLIPLIIFFLLKDKKKMQHVVLRVLPKERGLAAVVWLEMNRQISNYIRGKVIEIAVVAIATYLVFFIFDLQYALLLALLTGFSVLIPYIGAVLVTIPVILVALFQWGFMGDFWALFIAYLAVQGLDGNVLVPLLFSEAVNLHPLVIILSVIIFGGLWGFWGVFFAIPLATLIKAVIYAWPEDKLHTAV